MRKTEDQRFFIIEKVIEALHLFSQHNAKTIVTHFDDCEIIIAPNGFWNDELEKRSIDIERANLGQ